MRWKSTTLVVALAAVAFGQAPAEPAAGLLSPEQEAAIQASATKVEYQADVSRLMKIVVSNLYESNDVWVRELLSNSNDALEKTRLLSLTQPEILGAAPELNVTIAVDREGKRIVIRDSGIGMTKEQLTQNLGTIARSGTSEFLEKLEKGDGSNLIGQFGLGFYSSFLVADRVTVASKSIDSPTQFVFETAAEAQGFQIAEDPRGNTLGRGTEITLHLKSDQLEYLENEKLKELIRKHAEFGASPIYLWEETISEVEDENSPDFEEEEEEENEDDGDDVFKLPKQTKPRPTKQMKATEWTLVNDRAPLWMRDPKEVSKTEYEEFYKAAFKDSAAPISWSHFKGDIGSTSFRALVYLPSVLPADFYSKEYVGLQSLKLFVRRVFITNDLGKGYLDRHLNWVKVIIDVDDLPLNVGRDSLQKTKAMAQIRKNLMKRIYDLFARTAEEENEKFLSLYEKAGTALKVGVLEDQKNRDRILSLLRFRTSALPIGNLTSLHEAVLRRKQGQTQLFFMAGAGQDQKDLAKSPFVEKLISRGYEVLFFTDPMDEMLVSSVPKFEGLQFQDVAKEGLKFGDEDAADKEEEETLKSKFQPLADYVQKELGEFVSNVVISTRLTSSPCLVVASKAGYSGNMERLIASQNQGSGENFLTAFAKQQKKTFEINPTHPLIERLLEKVEDLDETDTEESVALKESVQVLWQTALVKSGFQPNDVNKFFGQIETILRRSLGVSAQAEAQIEVKPAPPVETGPINLNEPEASAPDFGGFGGAPGGGFADWDKIKQKIQNEGGATQADPVADAEPAEPAQPIIHNEL